MDKQTLIDYVANERQRGVRDEDIRSELLSKGWADLMISGVLDIPAQGLSSSLPSISALIKNSFDELWRNVWKAFLIMVLPIVLVGLVGIAGGVSMAFIHSQALLIGVGGLVFVAIVLTCIVMFISTIMLIKEIASGWTLSYGTALSASFPYIFPLLLVALLTTLAVFGGLTLFIVPGLLATIWYAFAQIATVIDDKKGISALLYSKELVRGKLTTVFGYYVVVVVIVTIVNLALGLIPVVGSFASLLTTPFMLIFSVHFYKALQRTTVVVDVSPNSNRFTIVLITLGVTATIGVIWLMSRFPLQ